MIQLSSISRLLIEQQFAALGIETTNARLHISTPRPTFQIENIRPEMTIDREGPSFELDWQTVRNESGLRSPNNLSRTLRDKAYGQTMQYVAQAVQDGNQLGDVEHPGNRVAQIAKQSTRRRTQTEINIGLMPKHSPKVKWNPGHVNVNWSRHQLIVEWDTEFMPEFVVDPPYSVEIFLRDRPYIKISIAEGEAPYDPGRVVDTSL